MLAGGSDVCWRGTVTCLGGARGAMTFLGGGRADPSLEVEDAEGGGVTTMWTSLTPMGGGCDNRGRSV